MRAIVPHEWRKKEEKREIPSIFIIILIRIRKVVELRRLNNFFIRFQEASHLIRDFWVPFCLLWRILIFLFRFLWFYFTAFTIRWIFWAVSWNHQKQTHQQTHQPHRFITCFLKRFTQKIMADTNWNTKK